MKLEIGESLALSYLKHVKKCTLYQTNWKSTSQWEVFNSEQLENLYKKMKSIENFNVFGRSSLNQLLRQGEIDVIGLDSSNTIYAIDIAFHEGGLNYGSKEETKDRVIKKLLRNYLTLLAYFPDKNYELIFLSPKTNNATEEIIQTYFEELKDTFSNGRVKFSYISNQDFLEEITLPTIRLGHQNADTSELFIRSTKLINLLGLYADPQIEEEAPKPKKKETSKNFTLVFSPSDEKEFKQKLLIAQKAKRTWFYPDGKTIIDYWDASQFKETSSLRGNIQSNNKVRNKAETGLFKLLIEIVD